MVANNPDMMRDATIVSILRYRAIHQAHKVAYRFLADGERESESLTYRDLDRRAQRIAAELLRRVRSGDRAILLYPSGVEYVAAFFACLYAGVIAVPAYPPAGNGNMRRLSSIMRDCQARIILSVRHVVDQLHTRLKYETAEMALPIIETERLDEGEMGDAADAIPLPPLSGAKIAFLQYTSGSTADPKGVMVSHANIMHNEKVVRDFYGLNEDTIAVSWLPMYHDMGLLAGVIATTFVGGQILLMSPAAFVQKPARWLKAISRYRATFSGGPDFAYVLCARQVSVEEKRNLDLSCWTVAGNGAEPVRERTIREFTNAFAACGFSRKALCPCYGMAEGTLFVSSSGHEGPVSQLVDASSLERNLVIEANEGALTARAIVSCGRGPADEKIVVVDPETCGVCEEGRVGEIWIASSSVAQGYWNKPELTEATFRATLADTGEGPFLRTGDLGFLRCGELYVTGRQKDLIIINGRNHYPHDIELTAEQSHPALVPGSGAAFSVEASGQERLVIAYEIKRSHVLRLDREAVGQAIRDAVAAQHELEIHAIELVRPLTIPKTSSGKVQRSLCRRKFLANELSKLGSARPAAVANGSGAHATVRPAARQATQFSLFYFSSNEAEFHENKYQLLLEGARFADQHGFTAVWVPERHFHAFGGLYPNPSVLASALAVITKRVRIRAGSVVLPLHDPIRVAEEWSVVDNLSSGRVDLAFARGWNPNDFALAPCSYADALEVLLKNVETVRSLWRGNPLPVRNGKGKEIEIKIYPLPQQKELPVWLTCSGGTERFVDAGTRGWNVLTALLFQSTDELAEKIRAYRGARERSGHDGKSGHVTLMLHTFLGTDEHEVKRMVRGPLIEYLKSSADLWSQGAQNLANMSEREREEVLDFAFERYYAASGLFGTPESAVKRVELLARAGVDEIACLIDFGIETPLVLEGLSALHALQQRVQGAFTGIDIHARSSADGACDTATSSHPGFLPPRSAGDPAFSDATRVYPSHPVREFDENSAENQALLRWVKQVIIAAIARALKTSPAAVITNKHFLSLGINSLTAIEIVSTIQRELNVELPHSLLFEFSTVDRLSFAVLREHRDQIMERMASLVSQDDSPLAETGARNGHGVTESSRAAKAV